METEWMRISIFQPDIPQNLGALLRVSACLDVPLDIIEPCGFPFSEKKLKRTAMDYIEHANFRSFIDYQEFKGQQQKEKPNSRVILLTTKSKKSFQRFKFKKNDVLLFGSESKGVPKQIHKKVDFRLKIPMQKKVRSLNISMAVAIVSSENIRQNNLFK